MFSCAFEEFAETDLPGQLHAALAQETLAGHLAGHVSRDSTAISARERPAKSGPKKKKKKAKRSPKSKNGPRP